jgi:hypothetical protein
MTFIINNNTTLSTVVPVPNFTGLEDLKHDIMAILSLISSGSVDFLLLVSSIMWARIQHKIVLYLTAALAGMQWNPESHRYEPPSRHLTDDSDCTDYLLCCLLYLSMYFGFVKSEIPVGSPPIQAIIISLIPLIIPYKFYFKWPVVSKGFLLCWAQIWLQDIHIWLTCMIFLSLI